MKLFKFWDVPGFWVIKKWDVSKILTPWVIFQNRSPQSEPASGRWRDAIKSLSCQVQQPGAVWSPPTPGQEREIQDFCIFFICFFLPSSGILLWDLPCFKHEIHLFPKEKEERMNKMDLRLEMCHFHQKIINNKMHKPQPPALLQVWWLISYIYLPWNKCKKSTKHPFLHMLIYCRSHLSSFIFSLQFLNF